MDPGAERGEGLAEVAAQESGAAQDEVRRRTSRGLPRPLFPNGTSTHLTRTTTTSTGTDVIDSATARKSVELADTWCATPSFSIVPWKTRAAAHRHRHVEGRDSHGQRGAGPAVQHAQIQFVPHEEQEEHE